MPDAPCKTRIFVRRIKSIGFVDEGANRGADIIVFKRRGTSEVGDMDTSEKAGRKMSTARLAALKDAMNKLTALLGEVDDAGEEEKMKEDKAVVDSEKLAEVEKRATDAEAKVTALEAQIAELTAKKDEPVDVWKGIPVEVRKRIEDAEKRAADAEVAAKIERDKRETADECAKIKAELGALPVKAEEFATVLKSAREKLDFADACELGRVLKAANEQLKQSALFREVGRSGDDTESASAKINAKAAEIKAATPGISMALARTQARKALPEIAAQERQENSSTRH